MTPPPPAAADLAAKVAFLSNAAAFPEGGESVAALETHMSWVFLTATRAYKLKKPVRFPYLDFSSLVLREAACRAELRLNRRLAADVYLGLIPLVQGRTGLALGGPGQVVDWLVAMRRLDDATVLQTRLSNHVEDRELDRLAATLARFYRHAQPVHATPEGHLAQWRAALAYNRRVLLDPRLPTPHGLVRHLDSVLRRFLETHAAAVAERARGRRILDGHGDLRPEHIWLGDKVRIIDCLEFNAALRASDPLDEIAFLDLECERLGAPRAGARIRRRVLAALDEAPDQPLFWFYRCHRAVLRARLSIAHLLEPDGRTPEKWPGLARAYLRIAARDAVRIERDLSRPSGR